MRFLPAALLLLVSLVPGCASSSPPAAQLPAAFQLSITVVCEDVTPSDDPRKQASRYVIESDGWLRAGRGAGATRETLPPRVRRLSLTQRDRLWETIANSGLLEPGNPARIASIDGPIPGRNRPLLLLGVRTDQDRFAGAIPLNSSLAEPYLPLLDDLHRWAWMAD